MKEIFSAFGSEIFRPLATIVIPGALAISTWFVVLLKRFESFRQLVSANHTETSVVLVLVCIAVGLPIEDLGATVESRYFDPRLTCEKGFERHDEDWDDYLRLAFKIEPVGQRYLRTIRLRFKFEMGTAIALVFAVSGIPFLGLQVGWVVLISAACLALGAYLVFFEGRCSHRLLSETRREILRGAVTYPRDQPAAN